ncbi:MAG: hypothetical protein IH953_02840 [Chloroflexi bacterium]|nr:hypothetical protein [Chloroflexota bacterium]
MRKLTLAVLLAVLLLAMVVIPAFADVHGVSQASCGASGNSGATQSRVAGRPGAQIPVTASDGKTQGTGGTAPAQCP